MEKLIYALWRDADTPRAAFNERLLGEVADAIAPHVRALRINVQDDALPRGSNPVFVVTQPQMEAAVQVWVDTAFPPRARADRSGAGSAVEPRRGLAGRGVDPAAEPGPSPGQADRRLFAGRVHRKARSSRP